MDYKKICKKYEKDVVENLRKWIRIPSVYDETTVSKDKPFGEDVHNALDFIAKLAQEKGFNVDRCDGYCTEISFGEGKQIGIYAHADVVPVSGSWDHEPFSGDVENGLMYGRGTSDDKGPAMAAFYALCALKDNNLIDGYQVKLVIGGNEERGSTCLEYYFNELKKDYPTYGFTPDGEFPLIYGEKGISNYKVECDVKYPPYIKEIHGGVVANSVIDEAYAILNTNRKLQEMASIYFKATGCSYEIENISDNMYKLIVHGVAAHGSTPNVGINAALVLLRFLSIYYSDVSLDVLPHYYFDGNGKNLGTYYESELLHETTYNLGLIDYKDGKLSYVINFRYPENVDENKVINKLNRLGIGKHTLLSTSEPLLMDPSSEMVKALMEVYQEETGDYESKAMTIGGGTYAKESKNTLAFGSHFPGRDDRIHNSNETIHISDLIDSMSIYAHAIDRLGRLCD